MSIQYSISLYIVGLLFVCTANANSFEAYQSVKNTPALELIAFSGKHYSLKTEIGKVVLVNFWGSWCIPCVREMPSLQQLENEYNKTKQFVIVTVNVNQTRTAVERFMKGLKLNLKVLMDSSAKAAKLWNVDFYPASFLVDKSGKLRYVAYGEIDWAKPSHHDLIDSLIKE